MEFHKFVKAIKILDKKRRLRILHPLFPFVLIIWITISFVEHSIDICKELRNSITLW